MNYYEQVAKMLGVELGESFYIKNKGTIDSYLYPLEKKKFCFRPCGLMSSTYTISYDNLLPALIRGEIEIEKKPPSWKPSFGETYFVPDIVEGEPLVKAKFWNDSGIDYNCLKAGNVFKYEEAARERAAEILKLIKEAEND